MSAGAVVGVAVGSPVGSAVCAAADFVIGSVADTSVGSTADSTNFYAVASLVSTASDATIRFAVAVVLVRTAPSESAICLDAVMSPPSDWGTDKAISNGASALSMLVE